MGNMLTFITIWNLHAMAQSLDRLVHLIYGSDITFYAVTALGVFDYCEVTERKRKHFNQNIKVLDDQLILNILTLDTK